MRNFTSSLYVLSKAHYHHPFRWNHGLNTITPFCKRNFPLLLSGLKILCCSLLPNHFSAAKLKFLPETETSKPSLWGLFNSHGGKLNSFGLSTASQNVKNTQNSWSSFLPILQLLGVTYSLAFVMWPTGLPDWLCGEGVLCDVHALVCNVSLQYRYIKLE